MALFPCNVGSGGTVIAENSYVCVNYAGNMTNQNYTDGTQVAISGSYAISVLINVKNKTYLSTSASAGYSIVGIKNNSTTYLGASISSFTADISGYDYLLISAGQANNGGAFNFYFTVS